MDKGNRSSVPGYVPCVEYIEASPVAQTSYVKLQIDPNDISSNSKQIEVSHNDLYHKKVNTDWKPNDYVELSVVACLFNFLFALASMTLAFKSQEKWKEGNPKKARIFGLMSLFLSLLGIISTAIIIFVCLWFLLPRDKSM